MMSINKKVAAKRMSFYPLSVNSTLHLNKFTFCWKIFHFEKVLDGFKKKSPLSSPIFPPENSNGVEWSLLLYPNGENPKYTDYISVFLALQLGYPNTIIDFTIALLDDKGNTLERRSIDDAEFKTGHFNICWGFYNFCSKDKLKSVLNDQSISNTITICCEIDYKTGRQDTGPKYLSNMVDMLDSGRFSDVTLICQDKKFKAHKMMLALRSPVFSVMFDHDMKETRESVVEIPDVEPEIMQELLQFIYNKKVDKLEEHASPLLIVASKYQIEDLSDMCQKLLIGNLNTKNVLSMLTFADFYNAKKLKTKAMSFVLANIRAVVSMPEYVKLGVSHGHLLQEILTAMALRDGEVTELKKSKFVKCFTSEDFDHYPTQTRMTRRSQLASDHDSFYVKNPRRLLVLQSLFVPMCYWY